MLLTRFHFAGPWAAAVCTMAWHFQLVRQPNFVRVLQSPVPECLCTHSLRKAMLLHTQVSI